MVKIFVVHEEQEVKIRVGDDCTVAQLQYKIRRYLKIDDTTAIFLFFKGSFGLTLHPGGKLLSAIGQTLYVSVLHENCFGAKK